MIIQNRFIDSFSKIFPECFKSLFLRDDIYETEKILSMSKAEIFQELFKRFSDIGFSISESMTAEINSQAYNYFNEYYQKSPELHEYFLYLIHPFYVKRKQFVLSLFEKVSTNKLLDIGCGSAEYGLTLLEMGVIDDYTGIDLDPANIELAKMRSSGSSKVNFINQDVTTLDIKELDYDIILLSEVLEHLDNPIPFLKFLYNSIKANIIITVPDDKHCAIHPQHNVYLFNILEDILKLIGYRIIERKELKYNNYIPLLGLVASNL